MKVTFTACRITAIGLCGTILYTFIHVTSPKSDILQELYFHLVSYEPSYLQDKMTAVWYTCSLVHFTSPFVMAISNMGLVVGTLLNHFLLRTQWLVLSLLQIFHLLLLNIFTWASIFCSLEVHKYAIIHHLLGFLLIRAFLTVWETVSWFTLSEVMQDIINVTRHIPDDSETSLSPKQATANVRTETEEWGENELDEGSSGSSARTEDSILGQRSS